MDRKKILLIEFCNYEDYPIGGYVSFAKNLMATFKNDLILIGITTQKQDPVGATLPTKCGHIQYMHRPHGAGKCQQRQHWRSRNPALAIERIDQRSGDDRDADHARYEQEHGHTQR